MVEQVFEAQVGRVVARKTLRPEMRDDANALRAFVNEAKVLGSLDHGGVIPRTPGFKAKLRRDWQIREYNGNGVNGTASLRELRDQPDLPDRVVLTALDPTTGEKLSVEVPRDPLGLMLSPAYERP